MGNRAAELLRNPDSLPQPLVAVPSNDERINDLYYEQHATRVAVATAARDLGQIRAMIQRALAVQQKSRYLAIVKVIHDATMALEQALGDEVRFHKGWAERGFSLWGHLPRTCMSWLAGRTWVWRNGVKADGMLSFSAEELQAIQESQERMAADSDAVSRFTSEELNIGETSGVIPLPSFTTSIIDASPPSGMTMPGLPQSAFQLPQVGPGAKHFS
jgi:hypothetical protein